MRKNNAYARRFQICRIICITLILLYGFLYAGNTFDDPKGRFSIDLPEGWKLTPQTDKDVYVFKGGDNNSIIMEYNAGAENSPELFQQAIDAFEASGLPNPSPVDKIMDLTVNAHPARWGAYTGEMEYGSVKVRLYGMLGSVFLGEGGVYFLAIMSKGTMDKSVA